MENCFLSIQLQQMKLYDLKPVDLLVFNLIAVASAQKSARSVRNLTDQTGDFLPTDYGNGSISGRRISEITNLARTSVSRSLSRLKERGMVVERGRGRLQVPVGIILQGPFSIESDALFAPIIGLFEQLARLGVVRVSALPRPADERADSDDFTITS